MPDVVMSMFLQQNKKKMYNRVVLILPTIVNVTCMVCVCVCVYLEPGIKPTYLSCELCMPIETKKLETTARVHIEQRHMNE